MLPEGVLEDDGADRGILFFCLQANLARQFEFVKTVDQRRHLLRPPAEKTTFARPQDGTGRFPSGSRSASA